MRELDQGHAEVVDCTGEMMYIADNLASTEAQGYMLDVLALDGAEAEETRCLACQDCMRVSGCLAGTVNWY